MPDRGAVIGSAEYQITVDVQEFSRQLAQAEAAARAQSAKIAASVLTEAKRVESALSAIKPVREIDLTVDTKGADAAIRQVQAKLAAVKDEQVNLTVRGSGADQFVAKLRRDIAAVEAKGVNLRVRQQEAIGRSPGAGGAGIGGFGGALATGLGVGTGAAAATAAVGAVKDGLAAVITTTKEAEQAQKALNIVYGQAAPIYQDIAKAQAAAANVSLTSTQQAVTQFATLRANYGLTGAQIEKLTQLTLDYAAVSGKDVVDVAQRLQSALRGEAEAAEALGLTLNSDAVKAMAAMTDEQRKNFESLDQVTKAQIIYRELLRQSANVQGAAAKNTDTLQGSWNRLAKESEGLATAIGTRLTPAMVGFNNAAADAAKATADWVRTLDTEQLAAGPFIRLPPRRASAVSDTAFEQAELESHKRTMELVRERARVQQQAAKDAETATRARLQRQIDAEEEAVKAHRKLTEDQLEAVRDAAQAEREGIEETRDADIDAVRARLEADTAALDARQQAAREYFDAQIEGVEAQRDRDLSAIEARKEAALAALEAERKGVEQARRLEDRGIEDRREAERRGIQATTDAAERGAEAERRGIETNRDAALRAIEARSDAEDRRHSDAMRNLDAEEARQLGIIDAQLEALDKAERAEQRKETDRSLGRARSEAKGDVKQARTPAERRRAERELADADRAIERERRRRQREDARETLRDRAEGVRKEFEQRKDQERQRHEAAGAAIEAEKQRVAEQANVQLQALADALKAFQENQQALLRALEERYKEEDRKREDARRAEDEAAASRRQAIEEQAKAEAEAVKGVADARIKELRRAASESDRYYAEEKRKAQRGADAEIKELRRVADEQLKSLRARLEMTVKHLQEELKRHQEAADKMIEIWKKAVADVQGGALIRAQVTVQGITSAGVGGPGASTPGGGRYVPVGGIPSTDGVLGASCPTGYTLFSDARGTFCYPVAEIRKARPGGTGRGSSTPSARASGGPVQIGRPYVVGEREPELFVPTRSGQVVNRQQILQAMAEPRLLSAAYDAGARRGGDGGVGGGDRQPTALTVSPTINVDARGVDGADGVADLVVAKTAQLVVGLLDRTERYHAEGVDRTLGGAV